MKERRFPWRLALAALVAAVDALIIFDAFSLAYLLRFRLHFLAATYLAPAPVGEYLKAMVVVAYFWILLFYIFGLYDFTRHRSGIDTIHLILKAISFGTAIILSLTYFYREFSFSRLVCAYAWGISVILFSAFRIALNCFVADWHRSGRGLRNLALIGSKTLAQFLIEKVQRQPELGYRIAGIVDTTPPQGPPMPGCPYLGNLDELEDILRRHRLNGVLIAHPTIGQFDLLRTIQVCERRMVAIRMVPPTYDLLVNYRDLEEVDGLPLVKINEQEYRRFADLAKRIFDPAAASVLLLFSLPLWGLIALFIKAEDGGPVFFQQARIGKDGRPFRMWKFRTMVANAEALLPQLVDLAGLAEPVFKLENDPRLTRAGRLLRRSSLDELPQLLNVILGEMSLVGPRPEEERLVRMYNVWEQRRLKAMPGITGLQQVTCRGSTSLSERVKWDILYLRKQSLALDLWILLKTVWVVLTGKGAR